MYYAQIQGQMEVTGPTWCVGLSLCCPIVGSGRIEHIFHPRVLVIMPFLLSDEFMNSFNIFKDFEEEFCQSLMEHLSSLN